MRGGGVDERNGWALTEGWGERPSMKEEMVGAAGASYESEEKADERILCAMIEDEGMSGGCLVN